MPMSDGDHLRRPQETGHCGAVEMERKMKLVQVVTYQSSFAGDPAINITPIQERRLRLAGRWPMGRRGDPYIGVYMGLHRAQPSFSAADIDRICAGAHAVIDILDCRED